MFYYSFIQKKKNIIFYGFISVFFFFSFYQPNAFAQDGDANQMSINRHNVIALVNAERKSHGIAPLTESSLLDEVAQKKLENMLANDYFDHMAPDGTDPWQWFIQSGYDFSYAGENLAMNYNSAQEQHAAWMASEKHRKNILDEHFTNTGVAVGQREHDGKKSIVTVQVFATPAKALTVSSHFAPHTLAVSDELFVAHDRKDYPSNKYAQDTHALVKAGAINAPETTIPFVRYPHTKKIAWIVLCVIVVCVGIVEYHLLKKKRLGKGGI